MLDNTEVEAVLAKLEELEDEELAVKLLKEFNEKTKHLGQLILNKDKSLDHEEWKQLCDEAKKDVDEILSRIKGM